MVLYAQNKKAKHDYEWLDTFEAGIVLEGGEVKSIRASRISLKESYVKITKNLEIFLTNAHIAIPSYIPSYARFDEKQDRKLLMHKKEILKLKSKIDEKGLTLIVTKIYQPENTKKIKVQVALARGKKLYDKKQTIKERDIKREMDRSIKNYK
jgi:SsrA-binding protein